MIEKIKMQIVNLQSNALNYEKKNKATSAKEIKKSTTGAFSSFMVIIICLIGFILGAYMNKIFS